MDKSDYANQQKSSGQWVIHFPGKKIMSGVLRNFWGVREKLSIRGDPFRPFGLTRLCPLCVYTDG
ncbi:hypothetical protein [Xenorhabdus sp. PB30.3]|uniref:hypothetical protein n=1 Tax=Xenorhabdus sp. PB30.3 TaxID=2788941 RepID=UPI0030DD5B98